MRQDRRQFAIIAIVLIGLLSSIEVGSQEQSTGFIAEKVSYRGLRFVVVEAPGPPEDTTDVIRYRVAVEPRLADKAPLFTSEVERVLSDPKGWASAGMNFVRVDEGEDITVLLARPRSVDALCLPMKTGGALSCATQRQANINLTRFERGSWTWGDDVDGYRTYLINHEVGHLLGMGHLDCPEAGAPAPVMMQQTIKLKRCKPSGTPTQGELETVAKKRPQREARWQRFKRTEARWRRRK